MKGGTGNKWLTQSFCTLNNITRTVNFLNIFALPEHRKVHKITQQSLYMNNRNENKKAVLPQGNRAMLQVFFSVEVRQQHSLQV